MKKQLLLLTAGSMLAFASCKNEAPAIDAGASQAQIDSIVNARVEEMRAELMAQNDSLINALAQWKADSMIAAMKGAKTNAAPKPKAKPVAQAPTPTPQKPTTIGNGKPRMDDKKGDPNTVGNGKPKMDDKKQDANTIGNGKPKMH